MRYGFLFIISLLALLVVVGLVIRRFLKNKRPIAHKAVIAHTAPIRELPEYKRAKIVYHVLLIVAVVVFVFAYVLTTFVAARPVNISQEDAQYSSHDVMLCIDISGSMYRFLPEIINYYNDISNRLKGQRVGITIFDAASYLAFPLSNDYAALSEITADIRDNPTVYKPLVSLQDNYSLIGNGVISCVKNFDKIEDEERSRAIILATDNDGMPSGEGIASLTQAARYAKEHRVVIYGMDTRMIDKIDEEQNCLEGNYSTCFSDDDESRKAKYENTRQEFIDAALFTGGSYHPINAQRDRNGDRYEINITQIVDQIIRQDGEINYAERKSIMVDDPDLAIILLAISTAILVILIWRLRI